MTPGKISTLSIYRHKSPLLSHAPYTWSSYDLESITVDFLSPLSLFFLILPTNPIDQEDTENDFSPYIANAGGVNIFNKPRASKGNCKENDQPPWKAKLNWFGKACHHAKSQRNLSNLNLFVVLSLALTRHVPGLHYYSYALSPSGSGTDVWFLAFKIVSLPVLSRYPKTTRKALIAANGTYYLNITENKDDFLERRCDKH